MISVCGFSQSSLQSEWAAVVVNFTKTAIVRLAYQTKLMHMIGHTFVCCSFT